MQLPQSRIRQMYIDQIKDIEKDLKDVTSNKVDKKSLMSIQEKLDIIAKKYQENDEIGAARYKLYELQALIHYFSDNDNDALDFINQAIKTRGEKYERAEKIKNKILTTSKSHHDNLLHRGVNDEPPLQLQALIRGQRSSAIIMAVLSVLSIYFIPWAIFYIILATKLNPHQVPSRKLVKAAAIATLPLCLGLIPIIIDIEFWKMNKKLLEFDKLGAKAFVSDNEYLAADPKRRKGRFITWSILLSILAIIIILIIVAITTSSSSNQSSLTLSLAENAVSKLKSDSTFMLPQRIDDITTLTDITSSGNAIQYHYQIKGADTSNVSNQSLRDSVKPNVCSNADSRELLDAGVAMEYLYDVYENNEHYYVKVQRSDCG